MARKSMYTILVVAVALALTSTLWAAPSRHHRTAAHAKKAVHRVVAAPVAAPAPAATLKAREQARCTATCAEVIPFYQKQYAARRAHEGAPKCWSTCWSKYGNPKHPTAGTATQKLLWQNLNSRHLRANQCAQTCWDAYHPNAARAGVVVAGYRSVPRAFTLPPSPTVIVEGVPTQAPEAEQAAPDEEASPDTSADQGEIAEVPSVDLNPTDEAARPAPIVVTPSMGGTFGVPYTTPVGGYGSALTFGSGGLGSAPGIAFRSNAGGVTYQSASALGGDTVSVAYPNASSLVPPVNITPDFESVTYGGAYATSSLGPETVSSGPTYGLTPGFPNY